jgi:hypothetical protein
MAQAQTKTQQRTNQGKAMSDGGKGDTQRPTNHNAYTEAHERIFGKRPPWYVQRDNRDQSKQQEQQKKEPS